MKINCFGCKKKMDFEKSYSVIVDGIELRGHKSCIKRSLSSPYPDIDLESGDYYLWSVDGSLKRTAVSVWNISTKERLHTCCFPTALYATQGRKLKYLSDELKKLKETYPPSEIAMEGSFIHHGSKQKGKFFARNESNKDIQQALGVTRAVLYEHEPHFYQPKTVKKEFAGNGDADKNRMIQVAEVKFGLSGLTDDEADSIGVGITHFIKKYHYKWDCTIMGNKNIYKEVFYRNGK